jgi:hypothetical protein
VGSYQPCSRRHCSHDLTEHRRARADAGSRAAGREGQLLVGACHHPRCECSQYVHEGLEDSNRVRGIYGDHGMAATPDVLEQPLPGDREDPFTKGRARPNGRYTPHGLILPPGYRFAGDR